MSAAIGAFMVGLVLAETSAAERTERLVLPLRDAFAGYVLILAVGGPLAATWAPALSRFVPSPLLPQGAAR